MKSFQALKLSIFFVFLSFLNLTAQDGDIVFPTDAGVIDVTKSPYYADNTGKEDATVAIQKAINKYPNGNRIIYLPNGTYLVSNTIIWPDSTLDHEFKRTCLQGQNKLKTIIKLKNQCDGYQDINNRKAVIWTGPAPAQRFRNAIRNITISTGTNNPGACGVQFNCSNEGTMQHVIIKSEDGKGVFGLDLAFTDQIGPGLIFDLTVDGFNVGIKHGYTINSMTFEKITLKNQKDIGFENSSNISTIRKLTSINKVIAVVNRNENACMTLIDSRLEGGSADTCAILNGGVLFARNVTTTGYNKALKSTTGLKQNLNDLNINEYHSHGIDRLFQSRAQSLNLKVNDIPETNYSAMDQWINPISKGAVGDSKTDDTKAIQDAIDAGFETVYLPGGKDFKINGDVYIRGNVKRLIGCEGVVSGTGRFVVVEGKHDTVFIERINGIYASVEIEQKSNRTLVINTISDIDFISNGTGDVYSSNHVCALFEMNTPLQNFWIRQLGSESVKHTNIKNNGANLWILGYKTERGNIKVHTLNKGKTEILGVHNYSTEYEVRTLPFFKIENSDFFVACYRETNNNGNPYIDYVTETVNEITRTIKRIDLPISGGGAGKTIMAYSSYANPSQLFSAPSNVKVEQTSIGKWIISWDKINSKDLIGYNLYYQTKKSGKFIQLLDNFQDNRYTFKISDTLSYKLFVTGIDKNGLETDSSEIIFIPGVVYNTPLAPQNLSGSLINGDVKLTWNKNSESHVSGYNIYRALNSAVVFIKIAENISDTLFKDTTNIVSNSYFYKIKAVNVQNKESNYSNELAIFPVGVNQLGMNQSLFEIYPNPAKSYIKVVNNVSQNGFAKLYKSNGQIVDKWLIQVGVTTIPLNSNIDKGVYILELNAISFNEYIKLIIE